MRTTFRRQVTLIVSLLLAATILLGVSFWGLFTHYVIRERESSLRGTAQSVVWLTQTSAVSDDVTTSWDFLRTLSVASSASGNDILLCDANGEVKLCAQDIQGCSHIGYRLPADKALTSTTRLPKFTGRGAWPWRWPGHRPTATGRASCLCLWSARRSPS